MNSFEKNKADLEHSRLLQDRINTALMAQKIGADAKASPSARQRADEKALKAQLAVLHRQIGEKLASKAAEFMDGQPGLTLAAAYAQAASHLGLN